MYYIKECNEDHEISFLSSSLRMKVLLLCSILLLMIYRNPVTADDPEIIRIVNEFGTWTAGDNFLNASQLLYKGLLGFIGVSPTNAPITDDNIATPGGDIPDYFDARENWPQCSCIRQIRDQGPCGACWAVSAAAAFTDRLCISRGGTFNMPLSAQEPLACCTECGFGCNGGYIYRTWQYLESHGIVTGGEYNYNIPSETSGCQPYEVAPHTRVEGLICGSCNLPRPEPRCKNRCVLLSQNGYDHYRIRRPYKLPRDVRTIQIDIMTKGPVQAGFTVYEDFYSYKSGVYQHVAGENMGGHAVKIIGWGVENGTPYWLAANQWGTQWGDNGVFKILRGTNECGFESSVVAGDPE